MRTSSRSADNSTPFLYHVMFGSGWPSALQSNVTFSDTEVLTSSLNSDVNFGTTINKRGIEVKKLYKTHIGIKLACMISLSE